MSEKASRYESRPKQAARANPVILGKRSASWIFWCMAGGIAVMIVGAIYWLLTHPMVA